MYDYFYKVRAISDWINNDSGVFSCPLLTLVVYKS